MVGYSAANVPEAETLGGDGTLSRTGLNAYALTVTKLNGVAPGALYPLNVGSGLASATGNLNLNITGGSCTAGNFVSTITATGAVTCTTPASAGGYPSGAPPQFGGFSATNTAEAETLSGDATFTRAGANSYTINVSKSGGTAFGTAAFVNTGTSGGTVPLLNGANTWSGVQTFNNSNIKLLGSSTGATTFTSANASATNYTVTLPANTGTLAELNLAQTWTAVQTYNNGNLSLAGATSGNTLLQATAAAGAGTIATFPANTGTVAELNLAQTWSAVQTFSSAPVMSGASITSATVPMAALVNSGVTAASYTSANITVNAQGLVTAASNGSLTTPISVANGGTGTGTAPTAGQLLIATSGTAYAPTAMSGDATINSVGVVTVGKVSGTAGPFAPLTNPVGGQNNYAPIDSANMTTAFSSAGTISAKSSLSILLRDASNTSDNLYFANAAGTQHWDLQETFGTSGAQGPFVIRDAVHAITPFNIATNASDGEVGINGGGLQVTNANGGSGRLVLSGKTSGYSAITVPFVAGGQDIILPANAGTSGALLMTDGSGNTSWARNEFNVTSYGAKCDGTTDDTTAIQNAFNAVKAVGYGSIAFPPGVCIHKALNFTGSNSFRLHGAGMSATVLKCVGPALGHTTDPCIDMLGDTNVTLDDMQFANGTGTGTDGSKFEMVFGQGTMLWSRNVAWVTNQGGGFNLVIYAAQNVHLDNPYFGSGSNATSAILLSLSAGNTIGFTSSNQTVSAPTQYAMDINITSPEFSQGNTGSGGVGLQFDNGNTAGGGTGIKNVIVDAAKYDNNSSTGAFFIADTGSNNGGYITNVHIRNAKVYMAGSNSPVIKLFGTAYSWFIDGIYFYYNAVASQANFQFTGGYVNGRFNYTDRTNQTNPVASFGSVAWQSEITMAQGDNAALYSGARLGDNAAVSLSSCGTSPTLSTGSSAQAGELIAGAGASSCTVNFNVKVGTNNIACTSADDGQPVMWMPGPKGINGVTWTCFVPSTGANCTAGNYLTWMCQGF